MASLSQSEPSSRSGSQGASRRAAEIVYFNEHLHIEPPCPEVTARLSTVNRTAVTDDVHGFRLQMRRESLLEPKQVQLTSRTTVDVHRPNAGLAPAVSRLLDQLDYVPVMRPRWPQPACLPAPDEVGVRWRGPCDMQMLELIREHDHGLVRYDGRGGVDLAWLIAQIALAYPLAKLAVVVASMSMGYSLRQRIARWVRGVTVLNARLATRRVDRVVIGTAYGMADHAVELNKRNIVIFPKAQDALHERAQTALMTADPMFRLFGFVPTDCTLSPYEQDWLLASFGFAEVTVPRHGFVERLVRTVWSPVDGGPRLSHDANVLALKRQGIWQHPVRNRRIARVALEFARRDLAWLRQRVPEAAPAGSASAPCRVMILVEGVDHALVLASLLPDWPVIVGEDVIEDGLGHDQRRLLAERRALPNATGPVIATTAGLARSGVLDLSTFDVLVWAGAGAHLPPMPADRLICRPEQVRGLLVVDLNDRHHPHLRRWSRYRREAYLDAGWFAPGDDPIEARVDRFLAQRPGGRAR